MPFSKCHSTGARHDAQRPSEAPPGRCTVKENELEDERQQHIESPHQGHGSGLLDLQGLREEDLAPNAQDGDQHQNPAITATERELPFPKDGYSDDALDETDDSVVPHGEVVMDALPNLAKDNICKSSPNCSYE